MATKKRQRFTKWRISDVVAAGRRARRIGGGDYGVAHARRTLGANAMEEALRILDITIPLAIGFVNSEGRVRACEWEDLTHEQRCDLIVAEARRLNVPMRAR